MTSQFSELMELFKNFKIEYLKYEAWLFRDKD